MRLFCVFALLLLTLGPVSSYAAGSAAAGKVLRETLEVAAKKSGKTLTKTLELKLSDDLVKLSMRYGDDVLPLVRKGGLEMLEQGARHGDEFWKFCKLVPEASRSLALHADDLLPLVRRIGPEVLEIESRLPGLSARIVREFGDDGIRFLSKNGSAEIPRLVGYAEKADTQATKQMLLEYYRKSQHPDKFLAAFNWKQIMATGLSASAIVAAYKISDGLSEGLRNPEAATAVGKYAVTCFFGLIAALLVILFFPFLVRKLKKGIAEIRKRQPEEADPEDKEE